MEEETSGIRKSDCPPSDELLRFVGADTLNTEGIRPGDQVVLTLDSENARAFAPRCIRISCFRANGSLVASPLERLPVLLKDVSIVGIPQMLGGLGVIAGISDTKPDPKLDPPPPLPESKEYVFRNIAPLAVAWDNFGWASYGTGAQLTFKNINDCFVHIFARIDGIPLDHPPGESNQR